MREEEYFSYAYRLLPIGVYRLVFIKQDQIPQFIKYGISENYAHPTTAEELLAVLLCNFV